MITLKKLEWDNWFSYGSGNVIDLNKSKLTQIKGKNGSGKTSIPLIIEEVLYGKNFRGIKKPNIPNRSIEKPVLKANLYLTINNLDVQVKLKRGSTLKLALIVNGEDISSHTSSATYNTIENLLGIDYQTFSQIVYQSSTTGLKFLTDTDSNRKKFLINLLNLDEYTKVFNTFKEKTKVLNNEILKLEGSCNSLVSWIEKNKSTKIEKLEILPVPEKPRDAQDKLVSIKSKLDSLYSENKKIAQNNKYKEFLNKIPADMLSRKPTAVDDNKVKAIKALLAGHQAELKIAQSHIQKLEKLSNVCPTCEQEIDKEIHNGLLSSSKAEVVSHTNEIKTLKKDLEDIEKIIRENKEITKYHEEFVAIKNNIDPALPETTYSGTDLELEYKEMSDRLNSIEEQIKRATAHNTKAAENNSKIELLQEQLADNQKQLSELESKLSELKSHFNHAEIIKKTFSTNGVISFKIESIIKELESQINVYLQHLSDGRFQLEFVVDGEKLNISIIDNGTKVEIQELSAGELSKVNASTLLAIRRLLSAMSKTNLNVLFLDEIMGVLDADGQEALIEILLEEENLNTFLVSHDYTHPLLDYIKVTRENGLSKV